MIYVYTSAAWNYLPKAQILAHSVKKYLPGMRMVLGLPDAFDDSVAYDKYGFDEVIPISEALCDVPNYRGWVFSHPIVELATAIKPFVLLQLLSRPDCEAVLYFDPDIVLFSELDDLLKNFETSSILLTPHVTETEERLDMVVDNELCALRYGVYNFGFYGIKNSSEGRRYAKWWRDRVAAFCYDDIPNGVFTDQKWNDLVPGLFDEVKVLRSPRFNVATWNTTRRRFAGDLEKGFTVNGEKLGFYHFTGFDSGMHKVMLQKNSLAPEVQMTLADWYEDTITEAGKDPLCQKAWQFNQFTDGTPIAKPLRDCYRMDPALMAAFPDPFDVSGGNNYRAWYKHNVEANTPPMPAQELWAHLEKARGEIDALKNSTIWRATKPLRAAMDELKRLAGC